MPGKNPSSIQGTADSEITTEQVLNIGETLGMQYKEVAIGYNMHPSSRMIFSGLVAGLTSTGASVRDAGILPLPVIPFASKDMECCIMIGNPDDRNRISGLTLMNSDGRFFNNAQMFTFTNRLESQKLLSGYERVGRVSRFNGAIDRYIDTVLDFVDSADCQMVIDCASDSTSAVVPEIMNSMGTDAIIANCQSDLAQNGTWSDMEHGNMRGLEKIVKANFGSIGVALNTDGSRIALIDEFGRTVNGESLLQLIMMTLEPESVALPMDISSASKKLAKGRVIMTPIGSNNIGEAVKNNNLDFGGCADGSFVFRKISHATDGITVAAIIAGIAAEGSLAKMVDSLPKYDREERSVPFTDNRELIARKISSQVNDLDYTNLYTTDGWRVEVENGWFLIRFSDNSLSIDIKVEGVDRMYTIGLMEIAYEIVKTAIKASI